MLRLPDDDQPSDDTIADDVATAEQSDVAPDATTDTAHDAAATDADAETATTTTDDTDQADDAPDDVDAESDSSAETFTRTYVERLRRESGTYRERARTAEHYAARLHTELVRATGKLADPTDLPFDAAHLDDPDALAAAIEDLLRRKPHLASRRVFGDVGQGNRGGSVEPVNLAAMLRQRAT